MIRDKVCTRPWLVVYIAAVVTATLVAVLLTR